MRRRSGGQWVDISVPIHSGMVHWPGDPEVDLKWRLRLEKGDNCNLSAISCSLHTGTHMDAPLHFLRRGKSMDEMPLQATVGPARVIEIMDPHSIKPAELNPHNLQPAERILFKTRNSRFVGKNSRFKEDFVYISKEAAEFLAEWRVQTVGIDYLSVGGFKNDGTETHEALLKAGIWIIEGVDLSRIAPGNYDLICLPLKVLGGDGAPARAIVRPRG